GLIDEYEFVVEPRLAGPRADVVCGAIEACRLEAREPARVRSAGRNRQPRARLTVFAEIPQSNQASPTGFEPASNQESPTGKKGGKPRSSKRLRRWPAPSGHPGTSRKYPVWEANPSTVDGRSGHGSRSPWRAWGGQHPPPTWIGQLGRFMTDSERRM